MNCTTSHLVVLLFCLILEWWMGRTKHGSTISFIITIIVAVCIIISFKLKGYKNGQEQGPDRTIGPPT